MTQEINALFSIFSTISLTVTGCCEKGKNQNCQMVEDRKLNFPVKDSLKLKAPDKKQY